MRPASAGGLPAPPVVAFARAADFGVSEIGAKATNLARLASAGFPVPPGLVVTPEAVGRWDEARPRLLEAAAGLGAQRFAVRSSGTAEDLEGASFAGQYETLLDVPLEGLPEAVRKVFGSASAPRVAAYREARGEVADEIAHFRMAVLVQVMVDAAASGVACTANPVTGNRGEVVVTAVRSVGISNIGRGDAKDITFEFSAPVESSVSYRRDSEVIPLSGLPHFKEGLSFLAPGAEISTVWDHHANLVPLLRKMELHEGISVTSRYESLTGERYETLWTINPLLMPGGLYATETGTTE